MKRTYAIAMSLVSTVLLLAACQPTPEKPAVVNKYDGQLEQKIQQSAAPEEHYTVPDTWFDAGFHKTLDATVTINASIELHGAVKYPIIRIKPINFTQEEADRVIHYFVGDARLYESENIPLTRAQLQDEILQSQAQLEKLKQDRPDDLQDSEERKTLEDWIKQRKEKLKTAPETVQKEYIDSKFTVNPEGGEELSAFADMGDKAPVRINLFNMMKDHYSDMFSIGLDGSTPFPNFSFNQRFYGSELTDEKASDISKQLLAELGIEGMEISEIKKSMNALSDPSRKDDIRVVFQPSVNGLPMRAKCNLNKEDKSYAPQKRIEYISVDMDPSGINGFSWGDKGKITDTVNENVRLMPFDQIQERFQQQIFKQPIWASAGEKKKTGSQSVTIDRIELCLVHIPEKNRQGSFLLIPAWNFYETRAMPEGLAKRMTGEEKQVRCIMTINAVDGSIVTQ